MSSGEERRPEDGQPGEPFGADQPLGGVPETEEPPREEVLEGEFGDEPVVGGVVAEDVISEDAVAEGEVLAPELSPEAADEPEEEIEVAREEVAALAAELEAVRRERDGYLDSMRRMKAELDNSRKRMGRERARLAQTASEGLVRDLLPVLDNLERALEVEGDIHGGVRATRDQFFAVLAREGLEPVPSDGEPFDPTVHEAVMGQPSDDHEEGTVLRTFEKGYAMNGRPIRAAKVVVAS